MSNPTASVPASVPASAPEHVPEPVPKLMPVLLIDGKIHHFPVWHLSITSCSAQSIVANIVDECDRKYVFADTNHMNAKTARMVIRCGEAIQRFGASSRGQAYYLRQVYTETLSAIEANTRENITHMTMCLYRLPIPMDTTVMIAEMVNKQNEIFFGKYSHHYIISRRLRVLIRDTRAADMVPRP